MERYARWFDSYGAIRLDEDSLTTGPADLRRLASGYGGQSNPDSIVSSVPGKGSQVRAALQSAATHLKVGQAALDKRQYSKASKAFSNATKALDDAQAPLRSDLRAVERTTGLRITQGGILSRGVDVEPATVQRWVDGDTMLTDRGRVRVLGINTPELRGACGPAQGAKDAAERLAPAGSRIRLVNPDSVRNTDRYGRLLRYVDVDLNSPESSSTWTSAIRCC